MIFHKKIESIFKAQMYSRCDDRGLVYYFSHEDFEGLTAEPYSFKSSLGHTLQGYFYSYGDFDRRRAVVFDHGFGGGHRSYMKEIELLCAAGYRVFAYDHTGCMESGGEGAGGFAQSLRDLDDCIKALKSDPAVETSHLSVMGHSWGGFSTLNITALHPDIEKIVVLSGFISVEKIIEQNFSGILKGYRKYIMALENEKNSEYAKYNAIETLQNSNVKALLIYSDNDRFVRKDVHYDPLLCGLTERENIELWLEHGKSHNPNYTADAVSYLEELSKSVKKSSRFKTDEEREAFKNSFDWDRMTKQDQRVWDRIIEFLR